MAKISWTYHDTIEAYKEGWAPFFIDDGYVIQKLDDPDEVALAHNFAPFTGQKFESDEEAQGYVKKRADEGNELAKKAIAFIALRHIKMYDEDPLDV